MRVLFAGLKWDYKNPQRGLSFEYQNFWDTLFHMPSIDAHLFPFDEVEAEVGLEQMNSALVSKVDELRPDLVFLFLFGNELQPDTIDKVREKSTVINWFADDNWRFSTYSRYWAPHLDWVITTYPKCADAYRALGHHNVLVSQWGCNDRLYKPLPIPKDLGVTFVGASHGDRQSWVSRAKERGLEIEAWGNGWEYGRVDFDRMLEIFSRSKVNLNLANSSRFRGRQLASLFLRRENGRIRLDLLNARKNFIEAWAKRSDQIKGRNFEVPGCRTVILTPRVAGLDSHFVFDEEIAVFSSLDELVEKGRALLEDEALREKIANAGYDRVLRDHTYSHRFSEIFRQVSAT